jgi:hypothetical protein
MSTVKKESNFLKANQKKSFTRRKKLRYEKQKKKVVTPGKEPQTLKNVKF